MPYTENAVDEFEAMDRICAELHLEHGNEAGQQILRDICCLFQVMRGDNPDAQLIAATYFRDNDLWTAVWPEFRPQVEGLVNHILRRVN